MNQQLKISSAIAAMEQALNGQAPIKFPNEPSWMLPLPRFNLFEICCSHMDCRATIEAYWVKVTAHHPECRARSFRRDDGSRYFIILAGFSELSRRISRADAECDAWRIALALIVQGKAKMNGCSQNPNTQPPLEVQNLGALDDPRWKEQIEGLKTVTHIIDTAFELDAQLKAFQKRDQAE